MNMKKEDIGMIRRNCDDLNVQSPPLRPLSFIYKSLFKFNLSAPKPSSPPPPHGLSSRTSMRHSHRSAIAALAPVIFGSSDLQLNQMNNKDTMNNWISMEASVGMHCELFDSNSRLLNKLKDESISEGFRYYQGQFEEQCQPTHPFSIDNTINFADIEKRHFSTNQQTPSPLKNQNSSPNTDNYRDWAVKENISRRGLKQLASLLLSAFLKKRFSSHGEVAQEIERHLMSQELHGNKILQRQQKNIKRRIYDALNVMISANVLEKELEAIDNKTTTKNYAIRNKFNENYQELTKIANRIEAKRQLLLKMQSKRQALRIWMEKKGRAREKEANCRRKLQFPLVFVLVQGRQTVNLQSVCDDSLSLQFGRGQVYSETDLLQEMYSNQDVKFDNIELKRKQKYLEEITYI